MSRTFPATQPAAGQAAAGAAPWDAKAARAEYEAVRASLDNSRGEGDLAGVIDAGRKLVEHYPRYAVARNLYAQALLFGKRFEPAYDQLKLSLDIDHQQPEIHFTAAVVADQLGRTDEAATHYQRAVDLAPGDPRYRVSLANAYLKHNDLERARGTLLEAIGLDSSRHEPYAVLSDVYARQGKTNLALDQIGKAIEHAPETERGVKVMYILRRAALLCRANRPEEALQSFNDLTEKERREPLPLHDAAVCWSQMGKLDRAAGVYEEALAEDPYNWKLAAEAARLRIKAGDKEGAKKDIDAIRRVDPRIEAIAELEKLLR